MDGCRRTFLSQPLNRAPGRYGRAHFVSVQVLPGPGPGHEMMLEKNSDAIIKFIEAWMSKNIK